jgi:hypothetical protein
MNIYVGNLPHHVTEGNLRQTFEGDTDKIRRKNE